MDELTFFPFQLHTQFVLVYFTVDENITNSKFLPELLKLHPPGVCYDSAHGFRSVLMKAARP